MPGTVRLMSRREEYGIINHADGLFANCGGNPNPVKTMEEALEVIRKWLESSYAKDDGLDIPASLRREAAS
jgi:hypothetical protein